MAQPQAAVLLNEAAVHLGKNGIEEAVLNAQWLLADALGVERLDLLADLSLTVPATALRRFKKGMILKERGLPLAYILGWQNFRGLKIKVDSRVLVPRPETEELAGLAADYLRGLGGPLTVMDYGAGSGAIGFWLAHEFSSLKLTAVDRSAGALSNARENAAALGLSARVRFQRAASVAAIAGRFNLIVSNPPYIPTGAIAGLSPEVLSEPRVALDGGGDGLTVAKKLTADAPARLKKGGALIMELGEAQAKILLALMPDKIWKEKRLFKDFNGVKRFVFGIARGGI